jgi:hypothetical protein
MPLVKGRGNVFFYREMEDWDRREGFGIHPNETVDKDA